MISLDLPFSAARERVMREFERRYIARTAAVSSAGSDSDRSRSSAGPPTATVVPSTSGPWWAARPTTSPSVTDSTSTSTVEPTRAARLASAMSAAATGGEAVRLWDTAGKREWETLYHGMDVAEIMQDLGMGCMPTPAAVAGFRIRDRCIRASSSRFARPVHPSDGTRRVNSSVESHPFGGSVRTNSSNVATRSAMPFSQ